MLNGLDLFSGIGGMSVALSEWIKPIAYCEIDHYCQGILLSRIASGELKNAPIWDDIKTLEWTRFSRGYVDIIFGGFPCQDISIAGHGKGLEGERSGLFFEIMRLAKEIKPLFIFLENVPALTSRGGLRVVKEITEMGYDCRWCVISAASIGALHHRERWFLLAYSQHFRLPTSETLESTEKTIRDNSQRSKESIQSKGGSSQGMLSTNLSLRSQESWETKTPICGVGDDVPFRVDRTRALGNAVVPQQAKEAFKILMGLK